MLLSKMKTKTEIDKKVKYKNSSNEAVSTDFFFFFFFFFLKALSFRRLRRRQRKNIKEKSHFHSLLYIQPFVPAFYIVISTALLYFTAFCTFFLLTITPSARSTYPYIIILQQTRPHSSHFYILLFNYATEGQLHQIDKKSCILKDDNAKV